MEVFGERMSRYGIDDYLTEEHHKGGSFFMVEPGGIQRILLDAAAAKQVLAVECARKPDPQDGPVTTMLRNELFDQALLDVINKFLP
jgi:hypothetical protein